MIQALAMLTPMLNSIFFTSKIPTETIKSFLRVEEGKIHAQYILVKCEEIIQDSDVDR